MFESIHFHRTIPDGYSDDNWLIECATEVGITYRHGFINGKYVSQEISTPIWYNQTITWLTYCLSNSDRVRYFNKLPAGFRRYPAVKKPIQNLNPYEEHPNLQASA